MAATFDPALTEFRDHIRYAVGDTGDLAVAGDIANALVTDELIDAKLAAFSYGEALAQVCEGLIARFGQEPVRYDEAQGVSVDWSDRLKSWEKVLANVRGAGVLLEPGGSSAVKPNPVAVGKIKAATTAAGTLLDS